MSWGGPRSPQKPEASPSGPGAHLDGANRAVSAPLQYCADFPGSPGRIVRCGGLSVPGRSALSRVPLQPTCGRPHLHQALGEEAAPAPQVSAQPAPGRARAHLPDHVSRRQAQLTLLLRAVCGQDQHLCGRTGRVLGSVQSTRGRRRAGRGFQALSPAPRRATPTPPHIPIISGAPLQSQTGRAVWAHCCRALGRGRWDEQ